MNKKYDVLILLSLVIIKIFIFYSAITDYSFFSLPTLITIMVCFSLYYISKDKIIAFSIVYVIISLILLFDILYFRYFSSFTTIKLFSQVMQIGDISSSILDLLKFTDLLIFIDLPILVFLYIKKHIVSKVEAPIRYIIFSFVLLLAIEAFSYGNFSMLKSEFFYYHFNDLNRKEEISHEVFEEITDDIQSIEIVNTEVDINESKYFGIAKDKNIIVIQVESLQDMVVNRTYKNKIITPFLNELLKDSFYFDSYYQQLGKGNTSDAEFVSHNSIYAPTNAIAYEDYVDYEYYGLPWILRNNNYSTAALHGYKGEFWNRENAYEGQGFETFKFEKDYTIKESVGFGLTDKDFFDQSIKYIKELSKPFYIFMITLTNHHPYDLPSNENKLVENTNGIFEEYLNTVHYSDEAIGNFVNKLKEEDLYEDSIIVIYGDHMGISPNLDDGDISNFIGREYDFDESMNIPFIIHIPNSNLNEQISKVGGQIDFTPTLLNIMGIDFNNRYTYGNDLLNLEEEGFIASQTYMLKGSFIQGDIVFRMSRSGVFSDSKAWSRSTHEELDIELCRQGYERATSEINQSHYILKHNKLKAGIIENQNINEVDNSIKPTRYIAHAGGRIGMQTYTNFKEALDRSVEKGYKLIEIDFLFTSDDKIVLAHSWDGFMTRFFNVEPFTPSYEEFMNFEVMNDWTQMDLNSLITWLEENDDIYIVTDTKDDNEKLLSLIASDYPDMINRFIPQIYKFDEYISANYLGYDNIIFTAYKSSYSLEEMVDFVKNNKVFAVTMPAERAKGELAKKLNEVGTFVYAHTINNVNATIILDMFMVNGYYTDDLTIKDESKRNLNKKIYSK